MRRVRAFFRTTQVRYQVLSLGYFPNGEAAREAFARICLVPESIRLISVGVRETLLTAHLIITDGRGTDYVPEEIRRAARHIFAARPLSTRRQLREFST